MAINMKQKNFLMGLGIGLVCSGAVLMMVQSAVRGETQLTEAQIKERAAKLGMVDRSENAILNSELQQVKSNTESDNVGTSASNDSTQENDNQDLTDSDTDNGQKTDKTDSSNKTDKTNETDKTDQTNKIEQKDSSSQTDTAQEVKTKDKKKKKKKKKDKSTVPENEDGTGNDSLDQNDNSSNNAKGSKKKKNTGSTVTIMIEPGMVADQICAKLQENHVIKDEKEFLDYIIDKSLQSKLLAGTFELKENMNYDDILQEIAK